MDTHEDEVLGQRSASDPWWRACAFMMMEALMFRILSCEYHGRYLVHEHDLEPE